jgi:eukaryotic-like serine/threonine-protein kinase
MEMIGRTLSRYRLLQEVGHGGMAIVYKAEDTTLNREVAVKVLHPHLAGQQESRDRLQREAHAVAKLRHENILEIFDYSGPDSAESYIVTEFIHGKTLKMFLAEHPLPFPEVAEMIASEVARALEHAHQFGVIHRDVKPENVMIRDDGLVKLMDFGIAQIVDKERMTVTGQLLGSPAYMAPEHVEGRPLDFRTDVFAVGILTYQLATGQLPFRGKNPHEVLKRIADCKFAPAESINRLIGKRLNGLIAKALAKEPGDRFADVADMRQELVEDLRDAGVDDAREELRKFFADPKGWARAFGPRLVEALMTSGKARAASGRTAAALELWGRALTLEPHGKSSGELRALVDGVAGSERRRRTLVRGALALAMIALVAVGGFFGVAAWKKHRAAEAEKNRIAAQQAKDDGNARAAASGNVGGNARTIPTRDEPRSDDDKERNKLAVRKTTPRPHATLPPVVTPPRRFELAPTPKAVSVVLDGKSLGEYGPQLEAIDVPAGRHTVRFESPYCFPKDVVIGDGDPAGRLATRLKWKPARLTIKAEPESADVLVDGSLLRSGQSIDVPIPELSDGKKTVTVRVAAAGFASSERQLELRANDAKIETVTLRAAESQ